MDIETYFETEEYKLKKQKIEEISIKEKYMSNLPTSTTRDHISQYIDSWSDLRLYLLDTYHHCTTDNIKRLFLKEFFKRKDKLMKTTYRHIIDDLKDLISFYDGACEIVFFKEFIEEKLKENPDCDAQHTLEAYFCAKNEEIFNYYVKKMNEKEKYFEKMEITRRFIEEKNCLSRPMNISVYLRLRQMIIDDLVT